MTPRARCTIVDYGLGNLRSIQHKLLAIQVDAAVTADPREVARAEILILPGVGHFAAGMRNLARQGLIGVLNAKVRDEGIPIMGICLGMQLFSDWSEEGDVAGLGWIPGQTRRFEFTGEAAGLRVPNIGWQTLAPCRPSDLLADVAPDQRFYFVHSYHVVCADPGHILATTHYGIDFTSVIHHQNVFGTQCHPEKSHRRGMVLYRSFFDHLGLPV